MTNQEAYKQLTEKHVQWGRKDDKHIFVWIEGYYHVNCEIIEKFLMQAKMRLVDSSFDKICGKTFLVFKHK